MEYTIIRSSRKTISIQLTREGDVVVRAPKRTAKAYIDRFVSSKQDWIQTHRQQLLEQAARRDGFSLHTGDTICLCGENLRVELRPGMHPALMPGRMILPSGDMDKARPQILRLSRAHKLPWLQNRLDGWAQKMGVSYRELKLSTARRRWGSCSSDGVIRISVFLLFAPERAIDYVLIHELAHRRQFNHSPAFWAEVEKTMPDYQAQRQALRQAERQPLIQSLAK